MCWYPLGSHLDLDRIDLSSAWFVCSKRTVSMERAMEQENKVKSHQTMSLLKKK